MSKGTNLKARRTQDWYSKLTAEEREAYKLKFPGTKFETRPCLSVPDRPMLQAAVRLKATR